MIQIRLISDLKNGSIRITDRGDRDRSECHRRPQERNGGMDEK